jgi:hypothetical protein
MEPGTDDCIEFTLATLYIRRAAVDGMIQRLKGQKTSFDRTIRRPLIGSGWCVYVSHLPFGCRRYRRAETPSIEAAEQ